MDELWIEQKHLHSIHPVHIETGLHTRMNTCAETFWTKSDRS